MEKVAKNGRKVKAITLLSGRFSPLFQKVKAIKAFFFHALFSARYAKQASQIVKQVPCARLICEAASRNLFFSFCSFFFISFFLFFIFSFFSARPSPEQIFANCEYLPEHVVYL
jgi:hypothetical protein